MVVTKYRSRSGIQRVKRWCNILRQKRAREIDVKVHEQGRWIIEENSNWEFNDYTSFPKGQPCLFLGIEFSYAIVSREC